MSPWRDVPQPRYVPSLYTGFAGTAGVGAGAAEAAGSSMDWTGEPGLCAVTGAAVTGAIGIVGIVSALFGSGVGSIRALVAPVSGTELPE